MAPWTAETFKKHAKKLTSGQAGKAAQIANAVLAATGDEGKAIRIGISKAKSARKKK